MDAQTTTRPPVVETQAHVIAAQRSLRAVEDETPIPLRTIYRTYRWAEAVECMPGISDEKVDALADQTALIWSMLVRAPITSRADAIAKLELVEDSFERGERYDRTDESMLRQVISWLRAGGMH